MSDGWIVFLSLMIFSLALRLLDHIYYSDSDRVLATIRLTPKKTGQGYYKRYDRLFATFPFLWSWSEIVACTIAVRAHPNVPIILLSYFYVATRFRALQEASHTAVHLGLCPSKSWQWFISDMFFNYPVLKPDMGIRYISHVIEHHRNANELKDPNIQRFIRIGFLPGLSRIQFYSKLFHPFTLFGLKETLIATYRSFSKNSRRFGLVLRPLVFCTVLFILGLLGGGKAIIWCYLAPLFTLYPFFSWISLLAEHRWFANCSESNRRLAECINGRPTNYSSFAGWAVKNSIFPGTDHYHLAHSLYPTLRWNYLPAVDRALKAKESGYSKYLSTGLMFGTKGQVTALSELRERMTNPDYADIAAWVPKKHYKREAV